MTTEQREELKKKFDHFVCFKWNCEHAALINNAACDQLFDFFYSEIENRDEQIEYHAGLSLKNANAVRELQTKLQRLEEIIKAANDVVVKASGMISTTKPMAIRSFAVWGELNKALEHYNKLKSKLPSGI